MLELQSFFFHIQYSSAKNELFIIFVLSKLFFWRIIPIPTHTHGTILFQWISNDGSSDDYNKWYNYQKYIDLKRVRFLIYDYGWWLRLTRQWSGRLEKNLIGYLPQTSNDQNIYYHRSAMKRFSHYYCVFFLLAYIQ